MKDLDAIFIETGTDKASQHPVKGHDYARHYDKLFSALRHDKLKVLEIGVARGESIRGWLEYFHQSDIYGVDNNPGATQWMIPGRNPHPRYTFVAGDQGNESFWRVFLADHGIDWHIVIDDGTHMNTDIFTTFLALWPFVRKGGFYCIEDTEVGYLPEPTYEKPGVATHREIMHQLIDDLNGYGKYDSVYFARGLVIIKK